MAALFWFRRDLRLEDNHGLWTALTSGLSVTGFFLFDRNILDNLEDRDDARVTFLVRTIDQLGQRIRDRGGRLLVRYGTPEETIPELVRELHIRAIFTNQDQEPYGRDRDTRIAAFCQATGIRFHACKDVHVFDREDVLKPDGKPYTVFTPYAKAWMQLLTRSMFDNDIGTDPLRSYPSETQEGWDRRPSNDRIPSLGSMGFTPSLRAFPGLEVPSALIRTYDRTRDFPGIPGTSRLGIHLRFGTLSIRALVRIALKLNLTFLNELIWRDFYAMILFHFPHVVTTAFRPEYDRIEWLNREPDFLAWAEGRTGYPLVDAGMRELRQTGYMHNRVRMVTASFLTKHLLVDWRWGEAWFARWLLDFDLASNNGGWQWAAGCGTDAAPYFRIFNPERQQAKFDPEDTYTRQWVTELWEPGREPYPNPIVDHRLARERCLSVYRSALQP